MRVKKGLEPVLTVEKLRTPWSEFWRKFKRQPLALAAAGLVLLLSLIHI